jgi:hypothetical protein
VNSTTKQGHPGSRPVLRKGGTEQVRWGRRRRHAPDTASARPNSSSGGSSKCCCCSGRSSISIST